VRVIELDGECWADVPDAIEELLKALAAPDWHGRNMNALIDSIAVGSINGIEPPYEIRVHGARRMSSEVRLFLDDLARYVEEAIGWPGRQGGHRKVRFVFCGEARPR
jgi:hypothetical protein